MNEQLLKKLRSIDVTNAVGILKTRLEADALSEFAKSGVKFVTTSEQFEGQFYKAVRELLMCIKTNGSKRPVLQEGGNYPGCWLESTGTINAELLSRFIPTVTEATYEAFADNQLDDGLFPYKIIADGPFFFQIQLVTPLARCVWNHYQLNGRNKTFLKKMYAAMVRYDEWLVQYRDTRNTGAVEVFCGHDTGHDLSARFWHVPDKPLNNDPRTYNPDSPVLPFIAPDLTANVACQRSYLAKIADELGEDGGDWQKKSEQSIDALFTQCFDKEDAFFYDRDKNDNFVKIQSDVLLRVLACEVGDDAFFAEALKRYLLNSSKFFARFPLTSIAMDDPRFDQNFAHNSWCGPTNLLTLIRTPHAFDAHNRHVELTWILYPILFSLFHVDDFAQTISPFTGEAGFTEKYSPTILCLLDFLERLCGIMPLPDGQLWFTGLMPYQIEQMQVEHETAYSRAIDGQNFELVNTAADSTAYRNGKLLFQCPKGVRIVTNRQGEIASIIGMSVNTIEGTLKTANGDYAFKAAANEQLDLVDGKFISVRNEGIVPPSY